jgi:hypothetical protein
VEWRYAVIEERGADLVLMDVNVSGHWLGGVAFEAGLIHLVRVGPHGRLVHAELFDHDAREDALARLDELADAAAA